MKTSDVLNVLFSARALLCRGWCQHKLAMDANGASVRPISPHAVAWCMRGAIDAVAPYHYADETYQSARGAIEYQCGPRGFALVNDVDARSVADVLAVYDRAIRRVAGSRWVR